MSEILVGVILAAFIYFICSIFVGVYPLDASDSNLPRPGGDVTPQV